MLKRFAASTAVVAGVAAVAIAAAPAAQASAPAPVSQSASAASQSSAGPLAAAANSVLSIGDSGAAVERRWAGGSGHSTPS